MRLDNMTRTHTGVKNFFLHTFLPQSRRKGRARDKKGAEGFDTPGLICPRRNFAPTLGASSYVNALAESWGFEPQIPLEGILA